MKYFNGNYHIYKSIYLRNWMFFSEFDTLLMYINLQTRSHIFQKISIFCKKIITFSSSAHLMKKSTFLPKFHFFFFAQNWNFCTKIDINRNNCHFASKFARNYFINELRNSIICPKTDAFCIKYYFLPKENNATKKLTLFKNRRYFFKNN